MVLVWLEYLNMMSSNTDSKIDTYNIAPFLLLTVYLVAYRLSVDNSVLTMIHLFEK
jgi:hypothetical protein